MSGISDSRWRSNRFTGDQVIFTGDQIDSPRSASKITKCVTGLKNKEPSKRKNHAPLIKLMEDDDSNLLREKIPLDNIVDDTVDVIRESPSRVLIIISAFFFHSLYDRQYNAARGDSFPRSGWIPDLEWSLLGVFCVIL